MRMKKVQVITWSAVVIGLFFLFCFGWAVRDFYSGTTNDTKVASGREEVVSMNKDAFHIVALGDSLTRGIGDETGRGYVGLVTEEIKQRYEGDVIVQNLGISGQESEELMNLVSQTEIKRQLSVADTILLTIGANDLFQQGQTLVDLDEQAVKEIEQAYLRHLSAIFTEIRSVNKTAPVFLVGLYNPFIDLDESAETSGVIREWNFQTEQLVSKFNNIVYVPTFDIFQLSVDDYLYTDRFHPNEAGYGLIADRVAPLITWKEETE
jgi:lysophospholipase L1-like esterase